MLKSNSKYSHSEVAFFLLILLLNILASASAYAAQARIKDLANFEGVRENDLVGYGLVVGLDGTGDGLRNSPFTEEAMTNLLERLGINVTGEQFRPKNVAAVLVTAILPPFGRAGNQIDVTVSAIGDSSSLLGGTLIMTPLNGADGEIYAVAQGAIISGGLSAQGEADTLTQGVPTSGSIPSGARIEREISGGLEGMNTLTLALRNPDFTTALRMEEAINRSFGSEVASMLDSGAVRVKLQRDVIRSPAHLIAKLENIEVTPSQKARVVVDHRSGTIVLGADVRISKVAVAQGNLTLRVNEQPLVVANNPFLITGEPLIVPRTNVMLDDGGEESQLALIGDSVTLSEVIDGLNALGLGPRDTINILKAVKAAGALHAEFLVQ